VGGLEGAPDDVGLDQSPEEPGGEPTADPTEGVPAEEGAPVPSAGCGSTEAVDDGRFSIDVAGNEREYILALPDDYDAERPYRLVFTWHPGGGTAQGTANNYYGLRARADDSAIFVSPEGIDNGWANTGGRDLAFLDAMLDRFRSELCFDETRLFSTGFSYGGMMSLAIGCGRADEFRAIAPMSGALFSGCEDGDAPIAMLGFHGTTDTVVSLNAGVNARNVIAGRNGCQPEGMAIESDGCLGFQGCTEGLTWCEFNGGHQPAPQSAERIWNFFSGF
jgi:predicted esterase